MKFFKIVMLVLSIVSWVSGGLLLLGCCLLGKWFLGVGACAAAFASGCLYFAYFLILRNQQKTLESLDNA